MNQLLFIINSYKFKRQNQKQTLRIDIKAKVDCFIPCFIMVAHLTMRTHMEHIRYFDLLKAFGYIERVVKSEKNPEKNYVTSYVRIMF